LSGSIDSEGEKEGGNGNGESQAWIAGPVLGGVLGAIGFMLLGGWVYRRRVRGTGIQREGEAPGCNALGEGEGTGNKYVGWRMAPVELGAGEEAACEMGVKREAVEVEGVEGRDAER
jgi:hypothetical protein